MTREAPAPRVLQLLPSFGESFGGPVNASIGVAKAYESLGYEVHTVAAGKPGAAWNSLNTTGFKSFSPPIGPRHVLSFAPKLPFWLLRHSASYDLVHIHLNRGLLSLSASLLVKKSAIPFVLQTHGMCMPWNFPLSIVDKTILSNLLGAANTTLTLTEEESRSLKTLHPRTRTYQFPNAIALPDSLPSLRISRTHVAKSRELNLLFCARLHPRKGILQYIRICAELQRRGQIITATVVGADEGMLSRAKTEAETLEVDCIFRGSLPRREVFDIMAEADGLIHPAANEPFGMSMIEAMSIGLPVFASRSSALATSFAQNRAATLIDESNADRAATQIVKAYENTCSLNEQILAAQQFVRQEYSVPALAQHLQKNLPAPGLARSTLRSNPRLRTMDSLRRRSLPNLPTPSNESSE